MSSHEQKQPTRESPSVSVIIDSLESGQWRRPRDATEIEFLYTNQAVQIDAVPILEA